MNVVFEGRQSLFGVKLNMGANGSSYFEMITTHKNLLKEFKDSRFAGDEIKIYGYISYYLLNIFLQHQPISIEDVDIEEKSLKSGLSLLYVNVIINISNIARFNVKREIFSFFTYFYISTSVDTILLRVKGASGFFPINVNENCFKICSSVSNLFEHYNSIRINYWELLDVYHKTKNGWDYRNTRISTIWLCIVDYNSAKESTLLKKCIDYIRCNRISLIYFAITTVTELSKFIQEEGAENFYPDSNVYKSDLLIIESSSYGCNMNRNSYDQYVTKYTIYRNSQEIWNKLHSLI